MATHLSDVIFRRTGLGTLGHPGVPMLTRVADLMARELDWDETRIANELAETGRMFETQPRRDEGDMQGASMAEAGQEARP